MLQEITRNVTSFRAYCPSSITGITGNFGVVYKCFAEKEIKNKKLLPDPEANHDASLFDIIVWDFCPD
jgi:hypothetical protein